MPLKLSHGTCFMLAGQGSQKVGMGSYLSGDPAAEQVFSIASDVLGKDVRAVMREFSQVELDRTANAQPALVALELAEAHALSARGVEPAAVLGFSLGQVAALECAGMLSTEQVFEVVRVRGELMDAAAAERPGAMLAVLRTSPEDAEALAEEAAAGDVLVAANYNGPQQTVLSGDVAAVERAEALAAERRVRTARLATSGAFHSPLMAGAAERFREYLAGVEFGEPRVPLIANDTAEPLAAADARDALARHLTCPVRFTRSVEALVSAGAETMVELGCGGVLQGLVRRIDPGLARTSAEAMLKEGE